MVNKWLNWGRGRQRRIRQEKEGKRRKRDLNSVLYKVTDSLVRQTMLESTEAVDQRPWDSCK